MFAGVVMTKGDIFIVDDNPNNLHLLSGILQEKGFNVRLANSGKRALAAVKASPPELVMLDITMPEIDGYEVCRRLKEDPQTSAVPIIFISALDDSSDKVRAFQVGGADYVTKPFQAEEVIARIEHQLKISRLQQALEQEKAELVKKNEELLQAQRRTNLVFSALSDALPGTVLDDKYRLDHKIGAGGFGAVFQGTQLSLGRPVAVKVFRPSKGNDTQEELERFRLEGISACRLNHPNAVAILDSGISSSGIAYLVMELLHGKTLQAELTNLRWLPLKRTVLIIQQVCSALAEAHQAGIIHRDIKPENIFLHQSNQGEVVKVVDFGIAKLLGEEVSEDLAQITARDNIVGTPAYMAPERVGNLPYDGKTDVYSVAVMTFQMLAGKPPFPLGPGGVVGLMLAHLNQPPPPIRTVNPTLPESVETVLLQGMEKKPALRPSADGFATLLTQAAEPFYDLNTPNQSPRFNVVLKSPDDSSQLPTRNTRIIPTGSFPDQDSDG
ncbi:MAG: response regulator [Blastocatellia bacterium]|nr:response regulator [Blastocatellia bacterium]